LFNKYSLPLKLTFPFFKYFIQSNFMCLLFKKYKLLKGKEQTWLGCKNEICRTFKEWGTLGTSNKKEEEERNFKILTLNCMSRWARRVNDVSSLKLYYNTTTCSICDIKRRAKQTGPRYDVCASCCCCCCC